MYFAPLFQSPTSKASPIRQRSQIGMANDRYSPITAMDVTAKKATGMIRGSASVPMLTSISAGTVTIAASTATPSTALAGTRALLSVDQIFDPGMAPSRLKANAILDADVRHDVAQKNWAEAEMNKTVVAQFVPSELTKM